MSDPTFMNQRRAITPPIAPLMAKLKRTMLFGRTPINRAVRTFSAVARSMSPSSLRLRRRKSAAKITAATPTSTRDSTETWAPPNSTTRLRYSGLGNTKASSPNTCTANLQGSVDGVQWFNIPYALVATPRTFVVTALTITTSTTVTYLLQELVFWRYLRVAMSASTNIKLSFTASVLPYAHSH